MASAYRFDKQMEFQKFFDSTPGPGSYNLLQDLKSMASEVMNEDSSLYKGTIDNEISKYAQSILESTHDNSIQTRHRVFKPKNKTTFSRDERVHENHYLTPGPGHYEMSNLEIESKRKRPRIPIIKDKKPALKLPFSLNNPLNYINSYTVNVYYKPGHPGVGVYDIDKQQHISGHAKFDSKVIRSLPFEKDKSFDLPIQYDIKGTMMKVQIGQNNSPGMCQPTKRKLVHLNLFGPNDVLSKDNKK
jgi:hypothetical protein